MSSFSLTSDVSPLRRIAPSPKIVLTHETKAESTVVIQLFNADVTVAQMPHATSRVAPFAVKSPDLWKKIGENVEDHMIAFLNVRELVQISKVSRSCHRASYKDIFWRPLLNRFSAFQIEALSLQQPTLSQKEIYIKLFSHSHAQAQQLRRELHEREAYDNRHKYSTRFYLIHSLPAAGAIASVFFETLDTSKRAVSIVGSSISIISAVASAILENHWISPSCFYDETADMGYRGLHATLGFVMILNAGLNVTSTPITAGLTLYNASVFFLKTGAAQESIPNFFARASLKIQALWQRLLTSGKKVFCCRSQRLLLEDL